MPSQSSAPEAHAPANGAVDKVASDLSAKLELSKNDHHNRHRQMKRDSLRPENNARKLSVDDDDWRSPSPAGRSRGDFSAFSSNHRGPSRSPSGRKDDHSPHRRFSGNNHRRSTSPSAVSSTDSFGAAGNNHSPNHHNNHHSHHHHHGPRRSEDKGRASSTSNLYNPDSRGSLDGRGRPTHLLPADSRGSMGGGGGSRNHSQTRRGRSLSPGRGKKELAYTACRKIIVEGDHADDLRAKIGEGDIVDVNELAFFGHSGSDGQTLLMVACKYGRVDIVIMLLEEYKADINMVGGLGRFNALHYAAWHGHPKVVRALLEHGADYTAVNEDGETAESAARGHGKIEAANAVSEWAKDPKCEIKPCAHETPNHHDHRRPAH